MFKKIVTFFIHVLWSLSSFWLNHRSGGSQARKHDLPAFLCLWLNHFALKILQYNCFRPSRKIVNGFVIEAKLKKLWKNKDFRDFRDFSRFFRFYRFSRFWDFSDFSDFEIFEIFQILRFLRFSRFFRFLRFLRFSRFLRFLRFSGFLRFWDFWDFWDFRDFRYFWDFEIFEIFEIFESRMTIIKIFLHCASRTLYITNIPHSGGTRREAHCFSYIQCIWYCCIISFRIT